MIRAIIYDCFGVLYRDNISMITELVSVSKRQELQDIIRACDHGYITRTEYFEKIAELTGKQSDEIRAVEAKQFVRNQPLIDTLPELRRNYKVGLLSNIGDETMDRLFPEPERSELFDVFVLSSNFGLIKPAREIFDFAANQLGLRNEECLMIDDRIENVEGARMSGMSALLFVSNSQLDRELKTILEHSRA